MVTPGKSAIAERPGTGNHRELKGEMPAIGKIKDDSNIMTAHNSRNASNNRNESNNRTASTVQAQ